MKVKLYVEISGIAFNIYITGNILYQFQGQTASGRHVKLQQQRILRVFEHISHARKISLGSGNVLYKGMEPNALSYCSFTRDMFERSGFNRAFAKLVCEDSSIGQVRT